MNTRQQIFIDRFIAKPLAFMLNFLVRLAGQILSIDHSLNKEFKTIAICKFKGMGSILQATPMIQAIRQRFPDAEIIFVSTTANRKILEKIDWIDTTVLVDDSSLFRFVVSNIRALLFLIKKRPEVYFDLEIYSDYSTIFTTFTLSKSRVGFYLRSSSFRMGIYTHMMFFNPRVPISKVYLQLAHLIGCDIENVELYPLQGSKPGDIAGNYIVINPNASDLRLERRWGEERFMALIERILPQFPEYTIYLVGSPGERPYVQQIEKAVNNARVVNIAGATSIDELIGVLAAARLMITNDTGPMHMAFSTQTPTICLFGPCSPDQYAIGANAHIIYKQVYCSPCVHDFEVPPCKGNNVCMKLITVDEVFEKVQQVLHLGQDNNMQNPPAFIYRQGDNVFGRVNR